MDQIEAIFVAALLASSRTEREIGTGDEEHEIVKALHLFVSLIFTIYRECATEKVCARWPES